MHTGRTIEELIELVQHIHTHNGDRPRASHDLAAPDRNARHHSDRQRYDQHNPERIAHDSRAHDVHRGTPGGNLTPPHREDHYREKHRERDDRGELHAAGAAMQERE